MFLLLNSGDSSKDQHAARAIAQAALPRYVRTELPRTHHQRVRIPAEKLSDAANIIRVMLAVSIGGHRAGALRKANQDIVEASLQSGAFAQVYGMAEDKHAPGSFDLPELRVVLRSAAIIHDHDQRAAEFDQVADKRC